jgi:hypothetical protein
MLAGKGQVSRGPFGQKIVNVPNGLGYPGTATGAHRRRRRRGGLAVY